MRFRPRRRSQAEPAPPVLSFGSWSELATAGEVVVSVCHPHWRGVRTATYSFGTPVVEVADAGAWATDLVRAMKEAGVETVVVQGFPPGADLLLGEASAAGLSTSCVLHSSPAQHGSEAGEAAVAARVLELGGNGIVDRIGFVKEGLAEVFTRLGHNAAFVPLRVPDLPPFERVELGDGFVDVGVFAEPFWRKNVATQLAAVALIDDARAHVLARPDVAYLDELDVVEHGVLPRTEFLAVQGSVALNLYVTLSECQPLTPLESYGAGVPCLASRTSALFRDDPWLWETSTVAEHDNPRAIAEAAQVLLRSQEEAVQRARAWMERWDQFAAQKWEEFLGE